MNNGFQQMWADIKILSNHALVRDHFPPQDNTCYSSKTEIYFNFDR